MIYQWSIKNAIAGFFISNHFRHSNWMEGKSYLFFLFQEWLVYVETLLDYGVHRVYSVLNPLPLLSVLSHKYVDGNTQSVE
jgi:hypothetical protein